MPKKSKVPKTIAGVKLPKPLRRGLRDLAATQTGRSALSEALASASATLAAAQERPADKLTDAVAASRTSRDGRAAAVQALEEATRAFIETLRRKQQAAPTPSGPPPSAVTH
jgi:hypothetical protein